MDVTGEDLVLIGKPLDRLSLEVYVTSQVQ